MVYTIHNKCALSVQYIYRKLIHLYLDQFQTNYCSVGCTLRTISGMTTLTLHNKSALYCIYLGICARYRSVWHINSAAQLACRLIYKYIMKYAKKRRNRFYYDKVVETKSVYTDGLFTHLEMTHTLFWQNWIKQNEQQRIGTCGKMI